MAVESWKMDPSSVWRKAKERWKQDASGTYRRAKEIWKMDPGGTWRKVFQYFQPNGSDFTSSTTGARTPNVTFNSDGSLNYRLGSSGTATSAWGSPVVTGIGASYWINFPSIGVVGTISPPAPGWRSMASGISVDGSVAPNGSSNSGHATYQISTDSSGGNIVATGVVYVDNDRT